MQKKLFINGKFIDACNGQQLQVIDPSNGSVLATVAAAGAEDVELAVQAAQAAFANPNWRRTSGAQRAGLLRDIARGIKQNLQEFAQLETLNNGKPLPEAQWDIEDSIGCFEYYATLAEGLEADPQAIALADNNFVSHVVKDPIGVVALIIPWNFPLLMAAWKIAPALAAGCTVILKCSEVTPLTALKLAQIISDTELPDGVVNILCGDGASCGAPLVKHPGINKIVFTGSVETGRQIMRSASDLATPVTLELGGKSALLIFEDVDLDAAVEWTMFGAFWNKGEVCSATSRVLVAQSIYPEFITRLCAAAQRIKIGNGLHSEVKMGPLVSAAQYQKVLNFIALGITEGAHLISGGKRPEHLSAGYFLQPTIFTDVPTGAAIWREEIFGPVVCVNTFSTEQEAIDLANNSEFGLAAAVLSQDLSRCDRVAAALDAGIVWINCSQPTFIECPWGGRKASGIGRELGPWGLDNYLSIKQVTRYTSRQPWNWYLDLPTDESPDVDQ